MKIVYSDLAKIERDLVGPDAETAKAAAMALTSEGKDLRSFELPDPKVLYDLLLRADKFNPGIADAYWYYENDISIAGSQIDIDWMMDVIAQRGLSTNLKISFEGNDLEFRLHEAIDDRPADMIRAIDLGFDGIVSIALDHMGALSPTDLLRVCQHAVPKARAELKKQSILTLAVNCNAFHDEGFKLGYLQAYPFKQDTVIEIKAPGSKYFRFSQNTSQSINSELWSFLDFYLPPESRGKELSSSDWSEKAKSCKWMEGIKGGKCYEKNICAYIDYTSGFRSLRVRNIV